MTTILGIDPGLCTTGYGAITVVNGAVRLLEAGVLAPPQNLPFETRLQRLFEGLQEVLASVQPGIMVIEQIWVGHRDPSSALVMGHARGVLCLAAALANVEIAHIGHSSVKRAVAGSGRATKLQVKEMVMRALNLRCAPEPDDVSDALAIALAQANCMIAGRAMLRAIAR